MTKQEMLNEILRLRELVRTTHNSITKKQNTRYLRRLEHKYFKGEYD